MTPLHSGKQEKYIISESEIYKNSQKIAHKINSISKRMNDEIQQKSPGTSKVNQQI